MLFEILDQFPGGWGWGGVDEILLILLHPKHSFKFDTSILVASVLAVD